MLSFSKRLRPAIVAGEITETLRFWHRPRVKVGQRYAFEDGAVEVTRIREIELSDVTPEMARRQGFAGLVDLLKIARHGSGEHVYLVEFEYHPGG
ncbi:MAG TPA: ASCH domain-containing protein [Caulobacteraceae bacterium]|nr:ASCH domain-containing protein [Caulobacteraceae bacterium]